MDLDKNGVLNAAELHVSISPPQSLYLAFCLSSVMALTPRAFVWRHIESCDVGLDVVALAEAVQVHALAALVHELLREASPGRGLGAGLRERLRERPVRERAERPARWRATRCARTPFSWST